MAKAMKKAVIPKPKTPNVSTTKAPSKSEVYAYLAESTGLSRKQVAAMFEAMGIMMKASLTRGSGFFVVPGLMKVKVIKKKAVPAREGVNPFTGQPMMFKAKPARKVVKVQPLKNLKAMVA
jgi:nucleoid DNA-binding protein